jgi:hypothetical protein
MRDISSLRVNTFYALRYQPITSLWSAIVKEDSKELFEISAVRIDTAYSLF